MPGGFGLGRLEDGMVVLVRHVLPGEEVCVRPLKRSRQYLQASLVSVSIRSADRVEPVCRLYGVCGGCDLQHASYAAQLRLKEGMLRENLARSRTCYKAIRDHIVPPLPSPRQFGYRQRIRLHVDKAGRIGFRRQQSHEVIQTAVCPLARPPINICLERLHASPLLAPLLKHTAALELLLNPGTGNVLVIVHYRRRPRPADWQRVRQLRETVAGLEDIVFYVAGHGLITQSGKPAGSGSVPVLRFILPPPTAGPRTLTLTWEAGGFCQVNPEQNGNMIELVCAWARAGPKDRVLDLYCGMGNFSLPLAVTAGEVLGLDNQGSAIRSARRNAALNLQAFASGQAQGAGGRPVLNCHFEKVPVETGVRELKQAGRTFDLILLDPPRQGAAPLIPYLADLGSRRLIYISCDPATLVRDLAELARTGFQVRRLQPVDMFPNTHHLETITLLEK